MVHWTIDDKTGDRMIFINETETIPEYLWDWYMSYKEE